MVLLLHGIALHQILDWCASITYLTRLTSGSRVRLIPKEVLFAEHSLIMAETEYGSLITWRFMLYHRTEQLSVHCSTSHHGSLYC